MTDTMHKLIITAIAATALAGCAQRADNIAPAYVSASNYSGQSCASLHNEAATISSRLNTLSGQQNSAASSDAVLTGVGLVLFWPALLVMAVPDGDAPREAEIAALKGQAEGVAAAYRAAGCAA